MGYGKKAQEIYVGRSVHLYSDGKAGFQRRGLDQDTTRGAKRAAIGVVHPGRSGGSVARQPPAREITTGRVAGRVGRRPQRRHPPPDGAPAGRFRRAIPPDAGKRIPPLHGAPAGRNRQAVRLRKCCRLLPHVPVADRPERGRLPARASPCQLPRLIHVGMTPEQKKQLHLQTN